MLRCHRIKRKPALIVAALAALWIALAAHANADSITFNFQENGSNLDLGPTSDFTRAVLPSVQMDSRPAGRPLISLQTTWAR